MPQTVFMTGLSMDFSVSSLIAGLVFGIFGFFFFRQGKRDANMMLLMIGAAMFVYPYLVPNPWACWGIGIALTIFGYKSM